MKNPQVKELVLQSLEHELGGIQVYQTALQCAVHPGLKKEWKKYLEETESHVAALTGACRALQLDPKQETPGRGVVRHVGTALVGAMKLALEAGDPAAAELVACECVVLAETKDHFDWELIEKCGEHLDGEGGRALAEAASKLEDQEDEHLYHTKGWCRELWVKSLGLTAVLPPPEEVQKVKTAMGAARAEQAAEKVR
ncbi:MAG TPA: hypothetical protein VG963_30460 [Polyangiaceae bacterium]|nr:hypothetical protein [Polyangiaceae bacterium]